MLRRAFGLPEEQSGRQEVRKVIPILIPPPRAFLFLQVLS
jgi:hypothetical protein